MCMLGSGRNRDEHSDAVKFIVSTITTTAILMEREVLVPLRSINYGIIESLIKDNMAVARYRASKHSGVCKVFVKAFVAALG